MKRRELSAQAGNPAHALRTRYQELLAETNLESLRVKAVGVVAGSGISDKNHEKFRRTVYQQRDVASVQRYLTNFILAADGLAVVK